jgi:hypothetical protein
MGWGPPSPRRPQGASPSSRARLCAGTNGGAGALSEMRSCALVPLGRAPGTWIPSPAVDDLVQKLSHKAPVPVGLQSRSRSGRGNPRTWACPARSGRPCCSPGVPSHDGASMVRPAAARNGPKVGGGAFVLLVPVGDRPVGSGDLSGGAGTSRSFMPVRLLGPRCNGPRTLKSRRPSGPGVPRSRPLGPSVTLVSPNRDISSSFPLTSRLIPHVGRHEDVSAPRATRCQ